MEDAASAPERARKTIAHRGPVRLVESLEQARTLGARQAARDLGEDARVVG
jgi:hypothetical protein